jgi:hypothetical protein
MWNRSSKSRLDLVFEVANRPLKTNLTATDELMRYSRTRANYKPQEFASDKCPRTRFDSTDLTLTVYETLRYSRLQIAYHPVRYPAFEGSTR